MSNSAGIPNKYKEAQGLLLKFPDKISEVGKKANNISSIFKGLDSDNTTDPHVHTFEHDCYKNLSALFDILNNNFVALKETLRKSNKKNLTDNVSTVDIKKKEEEFSNVYRDSIEAFKSFFSRGNAEICTLEYDTIITEDERKRLQEERLEAACDALKSIKRKELSYLDTLKEFKSKLEKIRDSYSNIQSQEYTFFNELLFVVSRLYDTYHILCKSLKSFIPRPLNLKTVNIVEMVTKLSDAIFVFIGSFKDIYIDFMEDYANKEHILVKYVNKDTFVELDKLFKSPYSNMKALFSRSVKLCESTNGEANKKADIIRSKIKDCISRIESAFEYSHRIDDLIKFRDTIADYKLEDKFIADGTRKLVDEWKSVNFTVSGKLPFSKFDTKKPISSKIYMFNNGLLLCQSRPKECKFIDFKDVDVTSDEDSLKLTHESTEWNITISNLGKHFDDFKAKIINHAKVAKDKRVFGTDLKTLSTKSKSSRQYIPSIIDQVIQYLLLPEPIKTEGILRKAANEKILDKYVQATDNGYQVHFNDPHIAAGFFKRWIRNIPGSLLMESKVKEWKEAGSDPAKLVKVFESLDRPNRAVFRELIALSCKIMAEESSNLMNKDAILTCLQMIVLEDRYVSNTILSVFLDDPNLIGVTVDNHNKPNTGLVSPVKHNLNFNELPEDYFTSNNDNSNGNDDDDDDDDNKHDASSSYQSPPPTPPNKFNTYTNVIPNFSPNSNHGMQRVKASPPFGPNMIGRNPSPININDGQNSSNSSTSTGRPPSPPPPVPPSVPNPNPCFNPNPNTNYGMQKLRRSNPPFVQKSSK